MTSKKILFTASIPAHFKAFHLPYLKWFHENGHEIHTISNGNLDLPYIDKQWSVEIERSPFSMKNIKAYKEIKRIIDKEDYDLINCHTPVASILTRLAAISARKKGSKVLYTAHGFHFYKGASLFYWTIFYPLEIYFSRFTDAIITLNKEDFEIIKRKGFSKTDYYRIPGIGVDKQRFFPIASDCKKELRIMKNIPDDKFILIYAAEFIPRKNHKFIIDAINAQKKSFDDIAVFFAGKGELERKLKSEVDRHKLNDIIKFIGFRSDIDEIYKVADAGISSSTQEGLAINIIEEMMCGLPIVASNVRGQAELIEHNINGYLYEQGDIEEFVQFILQLANNPETYTGLSRNSIELSKKFELEKSLKAMTKIYKKYL